MSKGRETQPALKSKRCKSEAIIFTDSFKFLQKYSSKIVGGSEYNNSG